MQLFLILKEIVQFFNALKIFLYLMSLPLNMANYKLAIFAFINSLKLKCRSGATSQWFIVL